MFTWAGQHLWLRYDTVRGGGSKRELWSLLRSLLAFSHFPRYPQANWALLVLLPGWVCLCTFQDPVGLSNQLSCEAGSLSHCRSTPTRVFNQRFEASLPSVGALGCAVCLAPQLLLLVYLDVNVGPPSLPATTLLQVLFAQLPVSALPPVWVSVSSLTPWLLNFRTVRLDFLSDLVVFCFEIVVLLLVVRGGTVCLSTPPSWPEVLFFFF